MFVFTQPLPQVWHKVCKSSNKAELDTAGELKTNL